MEAGYLSKIFTLIELGEKSVIFVWYFEPQMSGGKV
jgi:hypothetical protein